MAENYKLVSEDEWQAMVDRAEVAKGWSEHFKDRAETAESLSAYWKEEARSAERKIASFLDARADREEPVEWADRAKTATVSRYDTDGRLIYHGPVDSAPAFGEFETGTRDNADHFEYVTENGVRTPIERPRKVKWYEQDEPRPLPPYMGPEPCEHLAEAREAGPQTTVSSTSESAPNFVYAFPQRPHDSLVWAILFAGYSAHGGTGAGVLADSALMYWRDRWPESDK